MTCKGFTTFACTLWQRIVTQQENKKCIHNNRQRLSRCRDSIVVCTSTRYNHNNSISAAAHLCSPCFSTGTTIIHKNKNEHDLRRRRTLSSSSTTHRILDKVLQVEQDHSYSITDDDDNVTNDNNNTSDHDNGTGAAIRYGTYTAVIPSPLPIDPLHKLAPYLRHSIRSPHTLLSSSSTNTTTTTTSSPPPIIIHNNNNNNPSSKLFPGSPFTITFLGTGGGGRANAVRNPSSTILKLGGMSFLFDAGEGVQKQLCLSKKLSTLLEINKIFITHLHADHVAGLLPLILQIHNAATTSTTAMNSNSNNSNNNNNNSSSGGNAQDDTTIRTLEIYGPPGLYNFIAMNIAYTCSVLKHLKVIVYELVDDAIQQQQQQQQQKEQDYNANITIKGKMNKKKHLSKSNSNHKHHHHHHHNNNIFHLSIPQIQNPNIIQRYISKNTITNTWDIQTIPIITREMVEYDLQYNTPSPRGSRNSNSSNTTTTNKNTTSFSISCAQVHHKTGVATFGYVIEESPPQLLINVTKAIELGVKPSRKYRLLKHGFSVFTDEYDEEQQRLLEQVERHLNSNGEEMNDTTTTTNITTISNTSSIKREVHPEQVMIPNKIKARKFALLGDTWHVTDAMKKLCQNVDLLVHEATLLDHNESLAQLRGHSTSAMAGRIAKEVNAKVLVLNHLSSKTNHSHEIIDMLVKGAEDGCEGECPVVAAYDFMEIHIPREGFPF